MPAVFLQSVKKDYYLGKTVVHALRGIDLTIETGDFMVIAGPSGSGKSTLLNLIGCLDYPSSGEVRLEDQLVSDLTESELDQIRRQYLGFIFQSFNLIPVLNVYENIELPLLIRPDIPIPERHRRVQYFIEKVGLTGQVKQKPAELSGGQQQRVAVARALVTKPRLVLADEPTANLDSKTGIEIIELMQEINHTESTTFIFSTHDPKVAAKIKKPSVKERHHLTVAFLTEKEIRFMLNHSPLQGPGRLPYIR
ncbi:MAG TPA: ABC transporter ATP-binding protein, partial [Bacillota bacterium]|nr:ABC transporter ATP-binding protein [Bacillota bacterium]